VLFRFANFSVSPFPEVFEDFIDAVDVTRSGLPTDPINHDRPFKRIKVTLRLREDLIGSGRGAPCDEASQAAVRQIGLDGPELVFGGKSGDDF